MNNIIKNALQKRGIHYGIKRYLKRIQNKKRK